MTEKNLFSDLDINTKNETKIRVQNVLEKTQNIKEIIFHFWNTQEFPAQRNATIKFLLENLQKEKENYEPFFQNKEDEKKFWKTILQTQKNPKQTTILFHWIEQNFQNKGKPFLTKNELKILQKKITALQNEIKKQKN